MKGKNVEMARIVFNDRSSEEIRLYNKAEYVNLNIIRMQMDEKFFKE